MKSSLYSILIACCMASFAACTSKVDKKPTHPFQDAKWIDLTYPFDSTTL